MNVIQNKSIFCEVHYCRISLLTSLKKAFCKLLYIVLKKTIHSFCLNEWWLAHVSTPTTKLILVTLSVARGQKAIQVCYNDTALKRLFPWPFYSETHFVPENILFAKSPVSKQFFFLNNFCSRPFFCSWTLFVPFQKVPTRRTTPTKTTKPLLGPLSVARGQK